jgi:sensor histidine kinase YesM
VGLGDGRAPRGIGVENTRQRLVQLYGERQTFELLPNPVGGVVVTIRLPFRRVVAGEYREMATWHA